MALSTRFAYKDRRWQAQITLLANQPKKKDPPKIVRDANLEENVDNYLIYGIGDHGASQRLVLSAMSLLPLREKLPSARRSGGRSSAGVSDRPRFVPPPPPNAERALLIERAQTDTAGQIPLMPYGEFVGQPPVRNLFIGPTGCGKTTLMHNLIWKHFGPYTKASGGGIYYISRTLKGDEIVKDPNTAAFLTEKMESFDSEKLFKLRDEQKEAVGRLGKARAPHYLICVNDFAWDRSVMDSAIMAEAFFSWRHWNISMFVDAQKFTAVTPDMRTQLSVGFFFDCTGSDEKNYEDNIRAPGVTRTAFRDILTYALTPNAEELRVVAEEAAKRGCMMPALARPRTFLVYSKQCNHLFAYRRGLAQILQLGPDGWLAPPLGPLVHGSNPAYARRNAAVEAATASEKPKEETQPKM